VAQEIQNDAAEKSEQGTDRRGVARLSGGGSFTRETNGFLNRPIFASWAGNDKGNDKLDQLLSQVETNVK